MPVLRRHYASFIPEVPGKPAGGATPATFVLAAGYTGDEPFIVDVDPHGLIGRYEVVGFHAVGSGAAMAQQAGALLAQYRMTERSVDHGVLAAMRTLDALDRTSPSIGGPMNICRMTPDRRAPPRREGDRAGARAGAPVGGSRAAGAGRAVRLKWRPRPAPPAPVSGNAP